MNLTKAEKWQEINAAMAEHKAGLLTYSEVMAIVGDLK
jgi:hypothetical protein